MAVVGHADDRSGHVHGEAYESSNPSFLTQEYARGGPEDQDARGRPGVQVIQSVGRATAMLNLFNLAEPELTLSELAERLEMNRATAHRYGMALRASGLLRWDAARGVYGLGVRLVELGRIAQASLSIVKVATLLLDTLSAELNETAVLTVWNGSAPVIVRVVDNTDRLVSLTIREGSTLPLTRSAQGMLFIAHLSDARKAALTEERDLGEARLASIRDQGVCVSTDVLPGIAVVAVPILDGEEILGTLGLVCQRATVDPDDLASPQIQRLRETAAEIVRRLGRSV